MNTRSTILAALVSGAALAAAPAAALTTSPSPYTALPPFLEVNTPPPNVLIVLDNSNSMDENVNGEAVGSDDPTSRSEIARNAIKTIINDATLQSRMRFGLMAYRQSNIQSRHIHNAYYYVSHGSGDGGTFTPRDASTNTRSTQINGHTIYYDQALPYYSGSNEGSAFCYSTNFRPRTDPTPPVANINVNISQDNRYRCYTSKSGTLDISPDGVNNDAAAIAEYVGTHIGTYSLALTDSDVAAGFWQIGAQIAWNHVGSACLSTSTPGGGYLHVPVADSSAGHISDLEDVLDTWNGDCSTDDPLRNAGFTPMATTLGTARDYFEGNLSSATYGGPQPTPMQYSCQKSYVVLVTDGLPTEDLDNDGDFINDATAKAAALRELSVDVNGETVDCDVQTFVVGFALPEGMDGALDPVAVAGGTAVDTDSDGNGEAYYADGASSLNDTLGKIFTEIFNRTSSGTATAINLSSFGGEGMAVRATFRPTMTDTSNNEVAWTGHLNALFIDDGGNLREDGDGDGVLDAPATDPYVDMCYNESSEVVRAKASTSENGRPDYSAILACSTTTFDLGLEELHYLWDAGEWLADIPDANLASQRSPYSSTTPSRYIVTYIDADNDGVVDSGEQVDFVAGSFSDSNLGLLQAADSTEASNLVNQIRGVDQAGMRARQVDYNGDGSTETWRLGDIVYSSPTVVGRPAEAFDLIYRDADYGDFFTAYKNRRQVVYVGANDGMLHAFNGGFFDPDTLTFSTGVGGIALGAELWSFIPYNALPHLSYLADPDYGDSDGDHIYVVDLQPRVFDAQIFGNGGVTGQTGVSHPNGWGTVLVGGMRFGGGEITVNADLSDPANPTDARTLRSSFFILDITSPEAPPKLLMEFTHPELGYASATPAPIKVGDDWYLLVGSGPHPVDDAATLAAASSDQAGRLFLIDLKTMALAGTFGSSGVATLSDANSFVSDLIAVDYNLDFSADGVYFGTVSGSAGNWAGKLQRIRIVNDETADPATYYGISGWSVSTLYNTAKPITGMPSFALDSSDNRWVFVGSGRFLVQDDVDDTSTQSFFGVKEPRSTAGAYTWGTASALLDVSGAAVYENSELVTGVTATVSATSPCPAGSVADFATLECFLRQYSDSGDYKDGWKRDFPTTGQRSLSQATVLGGTLTYTGYTPSDVICEAEGESDLFALYFGTGTAYREPIIGLDTDAAQVDGNYRIEISQELGQGAANSPSIHSGSGYADSVEGKSTKAIVQTSTGTTLSIEQTNPFSIRPGEISWREH
jgi:Tfp pilus tip-associated adhesin PilY1